MSVGGSVFVLMIRGPAEGFQLIIAREDALTDRLMEGLSHDMMKPSRDRRCNGTSALSPDESKSRYNCEKTGYLARMRRLMIVVGTPPSSHINSNGVDLQKAASRRRVAT